MPKGMMGFQIGNKTWQHPNVRKNQFKKGLVPHNKGRGIYKRCPICYRLFYVQSGDIRRGKGVVCGKKCANIYKSKTQRGANNHFWKGGKNIKKTCLLCNKEYLIYPSEKSISKYCSNKCQTRANANKRIGETGYVTTGKTKTQCLNCNKIFETYSKTQKYCSKICNGKHLRGKNHCCWRGGRNGYRGDDWSIIRKRIYGRDNWSCKICGKTNTKLHCHHIVPYRVTKDNSDSNLITLCLSCHIKEEWKYYRSEGVNL